MGIPKTLNNEKIVIIQDIIPLSNQKTRLTLEPIFQMNSQVQNIPKI